MYAFTEELQIGISSDMDIITDKDSITDKDIDVRIHWRAAGKSEYYQDQWYWYQDIIRIKDIDSLELDKGKSGYYQEKNACKMQLKTPENFLD